MRLRAVMMVLLAGVVLSRPASGFNLPEEMRAVTINPDQAVPVGTPISPGNRVDILATYQDAHTHQELTKMILQNVLVLAVTQGEADPSDKKGVGSSMTLAVPPEQTELIAMADRAGALRISLRPDENQKILGSDQELLQHRALQYLIERYPNVEPSRLVYLSVVLPGSTGWDIGIATVVFGEKDILQYRADDPKRRTITYRTQYLVRLKPDGELVDIQRQERDDGVLIISPGPDKPIQPPLYKVPAVPEARTNQIIIIRPEGVPQTAP